MSSHTQHSRTQDFGAQNFEAIDFRIDRHVAVITLDRPRQLNTLNKAMIDDLGRAYRRCDADDEIRAVVLTGRGKAFCAGADMSAGADTFDAQQDMDFSSCPLPVQGWEVRKPIIAACNGHAIGVGLSMALQCDLRVFATEGKYGLPQTRRGVIADNAVEYILPRLVGFERAFEMIVRGMSLSGTEAGEWQLASRVVPAETVLETALEIARDMAENCSPLIAAMHKRLLWRSLHMPLQDFVTLETRALHYSMGRPDAVEGGRAWFEKRAPQWRSRTREDWPDFL